MPGGASGPDDFPGWLPPMLVKELRQGLRTRGFVITLVVFQVALVLLFIWALNAGAAGDRFAMRGGSGIFWTVLCCLLLGIMPPRGMASLREELEARTIDLLLLTRLTPWRIVAGKWVSLMAQAALLTVSMLPYAVVRYFFGAVDIVSDLVLIAVLYGCCGVLTAAGLCLAGLPKLLRGLVVPGAFILVITLMNALAFAGRSFLSSESAWWTTAQVVFDGGLLVWLLLVLAMRWFAPPSLGSSGRVRLVSVLILAGTFVFALANGEQAALQVVIGICAFAVVCLVELCEMRLPMPAHVRPWWRRGGFGKAVGVFTLPGWPSGVWFAGAGLALVAGSLLVVDAVTKGVSAFDRFYPFRLAALAWCGLVFPVLLMSFVPLPRAAAMVSYLLVQVVAGVFAAISGARWIFQGNRSLEAVLESVARVLPGSGFWLALAGDKSWSGWDGTHVSRAVVLCLLVAAVAWRSRRYWRTVRIAGADADAGTGAAETDET
jgi:ABC-type transport system involved in multi-copper enzyme maturation permease subunit